MGGQKDKCMPSPIIEGYLTPDHSRFIEEFLKTGDKVLAYENVYPEPKKSRKVLLTCANQLLNRLEIRKEIRAHVKAAGATKAFIIQRLMQIAKRDMGMYTRDGDLLERNPHPQSVNALRTIAEMAGYLSKENININALNQFNCAIAMPFSKEKIVEIEKETEGKVIWENPNSKNLAEDQPE